ncbi:hypothetical protein [Luteibaculum oceani]|uniref:DUF4199 domain-containing protein n=1 Tax=Luteibaculum oceani TaxID=1294296 RepID=A0A5C6VA44_9FLAO|nr:hypothetical protein [Luteibaculum oceani]TXC82069.1 hypothetical protein FRX97_02960 [Luteibaculum oceani]
MLQLFNHQIRFVLAVIFVVCFGGFIWGWVAISTYIQTGFFAIAIGFLSGFVASLYFERQNAWLYSTVATSFSFIGIFIGKYIIFAYYEQDVLFVQPEFSKFNLSIKALAGINFTKLAAYFQYTIKNYNFLDFFWSLLAIVTAFVNSRRVSKYKKALYRFKQRLRGR